MNQIDDLMEQIRLRIEAGERTLVTTLTKRMAEELNDHLIKWGVSSAYIHSDVDTLERIRILEDLRQGVYDVLIGVNLLREGLDLPQVSLVAILDADKGRLSAQPQVADSDCGSRRQKCSRQSDNVCRQNNRQHATHHRRDIPQTQETDAI